MKGDKRKSIISISIQNLMSRGFRTGCMLFFVFLLSFTYFSGSILMDNMEKGIKNTSERMGADLIIVPGQESENLKESLFAGEPCTIYFEREWQEKIQKVKGIKRVTSQLYLATMAASCCDAPVQLIGMNPDTDFLVEPWLKEQGVTSLKKGEVIIGNNIAADQGETIHFYDTKFKVAAKLEKTGMGYDNSAFMSFETIYELKNSKTANENLKLNNSEDLISMVLADIDGDKSIGRVRAEIASKYPEENISIYSASEMMDGISKEINKFTSYARITTVLLFIASTMALISLFTITINERKKEFGIMYVIGAKRTQIATIIVSEALIISILGGILGVTLGGSLIFVFQNLISINLGIPYFDITLHGIALIAGKCIMISLITGIISSIYSVCKISRESPYKLIRENE